MPEVGLFLFHAWGASAGALGPGYPHGRGLSGTGNRAPGTERGDFGTEKATARAELTDGFRAVTGLFPSRSERIRDTNAGFRSHRRCSAHVPPPTSHQIVCAGDRAR